MYAFLLGINLGMILQSQRIGIIKRFLNICLPV